MILKDKRHGRWEIACDTCEGREHMDVPFADAQDVAAAHDAMSEAGWTVRPIAAGKFLHIGPNCKNPRIRATLDGLRAFF